MRWQICSSWLPSPLCQHSTKWGEQGWGQVPPVGPIAGHFPLLCARPLLAQLSVPPPLRHKGRGFPWRSQSSSTSPLPLGLAWSCQCLGVHTHTHHFAANSQSITPRLAPQGGVLHPHLSISISLCLKRPRCTDDPLPSPCLNPLLLMKFMGHWLSTCYCADRQEQDGNGNQVRWG